MTKSYITMIEEAPDGSGDGILTFPDEMIAELGWKEGQRLKISLNEDGVIVLKSIPYESVSSEQQNT
jgi:bifunctional DNA-binding transcriptional regulator/antitoxin component of YhaV-PrlF toxin-antitoxin module